MPIYNTNAETLNVEVACHGDICVGAERHEDGSYSVVLTEGLIDTSPGDAVETKPDEDKNNQVKLRFYDIRSVGVVLNKLLLLDYLLRIQRTAQVVKEELLDEDK